MLVVCNDNCDQWLLGVNIGLLDHVLENGIVLPEITDIGGLVSQMVVSVSLLGADLSVPKHDFLYLFLALRLTVHVI